MYDIYIYHTNIEMKEKFKKIGEFLKKRWLVNLTTTIILVAIVIGVYVGVNVLLENVVLPEIDFTDSKIYSLSDETKDKVGNIQKEVKITLINCSDYVSIVNFIDRYVELNSNIKIEKINNLSSRNDIMMKYSLEPNDMAIIVSCENNEKLLQDADLYTMDYTTGEEIDKTEEAVTNSILDVSTDDKPQIYFMINHTMYGKEFFSSIVTEMKNEANEVKDIDILLNNGIPEDCDCLIITTLKSDITESERDSIINYIKNGGNLLIMCGPNITNVELTNFQKVLDEYGVTIDNGVVFEGEESNMLAGYPDFIVEEIKSNIINKNVNSTVLANFMDAGKINFNEQKEDVEFQEIARTSEKAFVRTDVNNQTSVDRTESDSEEQSITVAGLFTKSIDENKKSKLLLYANELFAMDVPIQLNGYTMYMVSLYNNKDIVLNSLATLNEREDTITIRKKADNSNYTVTEEQNKIIAIIIFAIPILIMIEGIVIWIVRRKK